MLKRSNCGNWIASNTVTFDIVSPLTNAGAISGGGTFCNSSVGSRTLGNSTAASGGCGGNIQYQWQFRLKGACTGGWLNWANYNGQTSATATWGGHADRDYQFRRAAKRTTCGSWIYSNTITIDVEEQLSNAGRINGGGTFCGRSIGGHTLGNSTAASGGCGGVVQYVWQQKVGNGNWSNINNTNKTTYAPPVITQTTSYRRAAKRSICAGWVVSNVVTKTVNASPNASIAKNNNITCVRPTATLTANPSGQKYKWSNGSTNRTITVNAANSSLMVYQVTVTGTNGCTASASMTVGVDTAKPNVTSISKTDATCGQNDGSITFKYTDAPSRTGIQFSLNGGNAYLAGVADNSGSKTYNNLNPGTYNLYVRWGAGDCAVDLGSRTISNAAAPNLEQYIKVNNGSYIKRTAATVCEGNRVILDFCCGGETVASGWKFVFQSPHGAKYPGGTNGVNNDQIAFTAKDIHYGTWNATYTNPKGCSRTENFVINRSTPPNASIAKNNDITCAKPTATLTANPSGQKYKWSNGSTNRTITVNAAGTYKVTVTNANGCSKEVAKQVAKAAAEVFYTFENTGCRQLDVFWKNGNTLRSYGQLNPGVKRVQHSYSGHVWVFKAGDSTIKTWSSASCENQTLKIDSGVAPVVKTQILVPNKTWEFTNTATVCAGTKVGLAAHPVDNATSRWSWTGPNGFKVNQRYFTLSNAVTTAMSGTYTATYTDQNGCVGTAQIKVTVSGSCTGSRNAPALSFAAFKAQRTVELQWLTNTGYKNDYFEVEHSTDGQAFTTIQNLANKEWSDELAYHETTDTQPTAGSNYYRVKQIYLDGSFDYTPIQKVDFTIDLNKINIFPNPAQNELFINLVPYAGKKGSMVLYNQYGQTIQEFNLETVDQELIKVNTSKMENGLYFLMIKLNNQPIFTEKLMIHRLY